MRFLQRDGASDRTTMYLWRKTAEPRWQSRHKAVLQARSNGGLAIISRPGRRRLQIEITCPTRIAARQLIDEFGGRARKLPQDWLKQFSRAQVSKPLRIGRRLIVLRSRSKWQAACHAAAKRRRVSFPYTLVIPAGAAFGTGLHSTTAMSLRLLEKMTQKRKPGWSVDLGTGSGILALAANCFGARRILGIDVDPLAISTAKANARLKQDRQHRFSKDSDVRRWKPPRKIDIVVANLFCELLIKTLPKISRSRWLIFSGILRTQEREFINALEHHKIGPRPMRRSGKWIAMLAQSIATVIGRATMKQCRRPTFLRNCHAAFDAQIAHRRNHCAADLPNWARSGRGANVRSECRIDQTLRRDHCHRNRSAASSDPGIDSRLRSQELYGKIKGQQARVLFLLFRGADATEKIHHTVGHIEHERTSGETIRDTFGDYITDDSGKVTYFEPGVLAAFDAKAIERDLKLWAKFSDSDGGILDQTIDFPSAAKVEKTLVLIKPDNFKFPNVRPGGVIEVFSRTGLYIVGFKVHQMSVAQAEEFYGPVLPVLQDKLGTVKGREAWEDVVQFMAGARPSDTLPEKRQEPGSEKCIAIVYQGEDAVSKIREVLGPTDPAKAPPGSIRKEFGQTIMINAAHASDSVENAKREMEIVRVDENNFKPLIENFYRRQ